MQQRVEAAQCILKDEKIEQCFEWKKGVKRHTLGIDITTEPFILDTGNEQQQKVR